MEQSDFKIYGYRWVVLLAFMFVVAVTRVLWLTLSRITDNPADFSEV